MVGRVARPCQEERERERERERESVKKREWQSTNNLRTRDLATVDNRSTCTTLLKCKERRD